MTLLVQRLREATALVPLQHFWREGDIADPIVAMGHVLGSLARRWLELHEEIKGHCRHLEQLTKMAAPELVAAFGIGRTSQRRCS